MPVSDKKPYVIYEATGVINYNFDFRVLDEGDLVVTVAGTVQVLGVDYAVTIAADPAEGGTVIFQPGRIPALGGGPVELERQTVSDRSTDYQEAGAFRQAVVDKDFDRLVMMIQERKFSIEQLRQLFDEATLALTVPAADGSDRRFSLRIDSSGLDDQGKELFCLQILQALDPETVTSLVPAFATFESPAGGSVNAGKTGTNTLSVIGATISMIDGKPTLTVNHEGQIIKPDDVITKGPWLDARAYPTLAEADAAAAAAGILLVISSVFNNVPATLTANIFMLPGGRLDGVGSVNITGSFSGTPGCFGSNQTVTGLLESRPEYFKPNTVPGVTDMGAAINSAISSVVSGGTVSFYPKDYGSSITVDNGGKVVCLAGSGSSIANNGTRLIRLADVVLLSYHGDVAGKAYIAFGGINDIQFASSGVFTSDMVSLEYLAAGSSDNLVVNTASTGAALYLSCVQDVAFNKPFLRGPGNGRTRGQLHLGPPDLVIGDNNVNDVRFINGHFEQMGGNVSSQLFSEYAGGNGRNNSVVFVNCKFEMNQTVSHPMFILDHVSRFEFIGCRYTGYNQAFEVTDSDNVRIAGASANVAAPSVGFGVFSDVRGLTIDCNGKNVGAATRTRCYRARVSLVETPGERALVSEYGEDQARFGLDYLGYFANSYEGVVLADDPATFTGNIIQGPATDYTQLFNVRPSVVSRRQNGMTLWIRAKVSAGAHSLDIRARSSITALDVVVVSINLTTDYQWCRVPISPDVLDDPGVYLRVSNSVMGGAYASIAEWYFEPQAVYLNMPSSGTWEAGAWVRNAAPSILGSGGYATANQKYTLLGWRRLTTGSAHVLNSDWVEMRVLTGQ